MMASLLGIKLGKRKVIWRRKTKDGFMVEDTKKR